jgi:hypothetical protein
LFLENGEERRVDGVRSFLGRPFDLEVEAAFEVGVILDGTPGLAAAKRDGLRRSSALQSGEQ